MNRRTPFAGALAAAALLALPACSSEAAGDEEEATATAEPADQTLAALVAGNDELSIVSGTLDDAGLVQVFDGTAPYTILAPQDSAFDKLGEAGTELRKPEQRAAMVAIVRDHIIPGYLTPNDIGQAIERAAGNGVKMRTMGDHVVTFRRDGDAITVTQEDGSTARLVGEPLLAGNGVAIPVDGVLKKIG